MLEQKAGFLITAFCNLIFHFFRAADDFIISARASYVVPTASACCSFEVNHTRASTEQRANATV